MENKLTKEQKERFDRWCATQYLDGDLLYPSETEEFLASELTLHDKELIQKIDDEIHNPSELWLSYGIKYIKGLEFAKKIISKEWAMREIKFRAWDKNNKKMLFDDFKINPDGKVDTYGIYSKIIVMQYTGLKDKNGKEIYEGDIVRCSMSYEGGTLPHMGVITYDSKHGSFATKNIAGITLLHNHCLHTLEVIGNIYENKELLNGK